MSSRAQNALATLATTASLLALFNPATQRQQFPLILPPPVADPTTQLQVFNVRPPTCSRGLVPNPVTSLTMPSAHDVNPTTPTFTAGITDGILPTEVTFAKRSKDPPVGDNNKQHLLPVPRFMEIPPSNPRTNPGNRNHRGSASSVPHLYHYRGCWLSLMVTPAGYCVYSTVV
jgi:hypothetical protein